MQARTLIPALIAVVLSSVAASAQTPTPIGEFNQWRAFSYGGAKGKVCYALSQPTKMAPSDRNHGDVFFFVSNRPGENVTNEPSVIVGYPFKDNSSVSVDVDGRKFTLFTKNDGAWMSNPAEERQLIAAMKAGSKMQVTGVSQRGTQTIYDFSLSGVTASITAADKACR
ncbi:invasion associated locus B family protein [Stappia indica]|uniref:invasion associated locus B family protein n=1 Tax=Stappia indica TaxID=538381 RepID=UPI001CD1B59B|nr:invasion associated locus B family protein [Stappia indica]MCA1299700.1 invasion associated locus B family protein [Stappia indica]